MSNYSEHKQKRHDRSSPSPSPSSSELEGFLPHKGSRHLPTRKHGELRLLYSRAIFFALIFLLVGTNVAWYRFYLSKASQPEEPYYGSPAQKMIAFDNAWKGLDVDEVNGHHYADDKWQHIFPAHGGGVALSRPFAEKHDLAPGDVVNGDPSRMHYILAGYHQLHCLGIVRETIYQLNGTSSNTDPIWWDHVLHCMELVRQALFCFMDDTLLPVAVEQGIPNDPKHVCRNTDAIRKWVDANGYAVPPAPDGPQAHKNGTKT